MTLRTLPGASNPSRKRRLSGSRPAKTHYRCSVRSITRIGVALSLLGLPAATAAAQCQWAEGFTLVGLDGEVRAATVFNDGSGDALYVGGSFAVAGDAVVSSIAKWNGSSWSALGSGIPPNGVVYALAVFNDGGGPALYAGGSFTTAGGVGANHIAKWDGASWSALGSGMSNSPSSTSVFALATFDDGGGPALYAAGSFTTAGGVAANLIAKWNGSSWSALGSGISAEFSTPSVRTLGVFDDGGGPALYAGGYFSTAGGVPANHIAKWNGSSWSALGVGMDSAVGALAIFDDGGGSALYAGGSFTSAGGVNAKRVARWNGSSWSVLGSGMNNPVLDLAIFDDGDGPALYAAGTFTTAGGVSVNYIAKWYHSSWSPLGSGMNSYVNVLAVFDDGGGQVLYAGGLFTTAGGVAVNHIAEWNGSSWSSPLGSGLNEGVRTLAVFDDGDGSALFAGGSFISAGGLSAHHIAKWNGSSWLALGSGISGGFSTTVYDLAVFDGGAGPALYAGGYFTTAGGVSANHIAQWDGSSWSALGSGMSNSPYSAPVFSLAAFDDGGGPALYAGGDFTTAGGVSANRIAKWNGSSWSPLGSGTNGVVYALAVFDDGGGPALYAGGDFTVAGSVAANFIAKWDGSSWSSVGFPGMSERVFALAVFDDGGGRALYAGGTFPTAGGMPANRIAKWDGWNWSPLGSGISLRVRTLATFDDGGGPALYAGGSFTTAGGFSAYHIAKWNGSSWLALGLGMSGGYSTTVYDLAVFDGGAGPALYAGGDFTFAGGNVSAYIAQWSCQPVVLLPAMSTLAMTVLVLVTMCVGALLFRVHR